MKFLKIGGGVVALLLLAFVGAVATQPDQVHVERSRVIKALPTDVHPHLSDFSKFVKWSPWSGMDPTQKVTFSDPPSGKGATYAWDGNDVVGQGDMKNLEVIPEKKVVQQLHFIRPFEGLATTTYTMEREGDGTKVTWAYDSESDMMGKVADLFMDMDEMLGADFAKGLDTLAPIAEADAKAREAAVAAAAAQAAADVAAAASTQASAGEAGGGAVPGTIPGTIPGTLPN